MKKGDFLYVSRKESMIFFTQFPASLIFLNCFFDHSINTPKTQSILLGNTVILYRVAKFTKKYIRIIFLTFRKIS